MPLRPISSGPQGTSGAGCLRIGVVVTTVGRWSALEGLLESVQASSWPDVAVAIANQSGGPPPRSFARLLGAEIVTSTGGASKGRNDAIRLLRGTTDIMAFPNDHSSFQPDTFSRANRYFACPGPPGAITGTLLEPTGPRMVVPRSGAELSRHTVWRAIEPSMFVMSDLAEELGFRESIGTGSPGPWQAGEGTDLLLRIMASGHKVVAAPDVVVVGAGQVRSLTNDEWSLKLRSYARGCGYVLRLHRYGPLGSAFQIVSPWYRLVWSPPGGARMPPRDCLSATVGRLEGRFGRCFGKSERLRLSAPALQK
ncbi:MAG TPA: glycosyltransferase family A protein [Acidimicrobiales bacterium]|nr:glycosyltransferase family A protein [Acidimicrobiales bacterium]